VLALGPELGQGAKFIVLVRPVHPGRARPGPWHVPRIRPSVPERSPERREQPLAVSKRPSYLKRQKEQQRLARAAEKRDARRARKNAKGLQGEPQEPLDAALDGPEGEVEGAESDDAGPQAAEA
jgi:hypothetical protein